MLVQGEKTGKIAETLGVTQRAVNKWREREDFQRMQAGLEDGIRETGEALLRGYLVDAIRRVGSCIGSSTEDAVALRAAFGILDRVGLHPTQGTEHSGSVGFDMKGMTPGQIEAVIRGTDGADPDSD